jgi:hypothetical protein
MGKDREIRGTVLKGVRPQVQKVAIVLNPPAAPSALGKPRNGTITWNSVDLNWTDNSDNETGFKLYIAVASGGPFSLIKTVGAGVTSTTVGGLSELTWYWIKILAYNDDGNSGFSNTYNFRTLEDPGIPQA